MGIPGVCGDTGGRGGSVTLCSPRWGCARMGTTQRRLPWQSEAAQIQIQISHTGGSVITAKRGGVCLTVRV